MKDGEVISTNSSEFNVFENGVYTVSVVDEYDVVATKQFVVDNYVLDAATVSVENTNNIIKYQTMIALLSLIVVGIVVVRRKRKIA